MHFSVPSALCWNCLTATLNLSPELVQARPAFTHSAVLPGCFSQLFVFVLVTVVIGISVVPWSPYAVALTFSFNKNAVWISKVVLYKVVSPQRWQKDAEIIMSVFSPLSLSVFCLFRLLWTVFHNWNFQLLCAKPPLKTTPVPFSGLAARRWPLQLIRGNQELHLHDKYDWIAETTKWPTFSLCQ